MKAALIFIGRVTVYAVLAAAATLLTAFAFILVVGAWIHANEQFGQGWFLWLFLVEFGLVFLVLLYNKPTMRQIFDDAPPADSATPTAGRRT